MRKPKVLTGTVITSPEERLADIPPEVQSEWGRGIDSQFLIGHLLLEARSLLPATQDFGKWLAAQNFPFSRPTAHRLAEAAEREPEVRAFIADRSSMNGRDVGTVTAIALLNAKPVDESTKRVKDLMQEAESEWEAEGCTPAFATFKKAVAGLDISQLPTAELVELAGIIQGLVLQYNDQKGRRA